MRKNLAMALFEHGHITTTVPKAKEVQRFVEKIITMSKNRTLANYRRVLSLLQTGKPTAPRNSKGRPRRGVRVEPRHKVVTRKLFDEIGPMMADRPGGYTRILRLAKRRVGDASPLALFALVTEKPIPAEEVEAMDTEDEVVDEVAQAETEQAEATDTDGVEAESPEADETPAEEAPEESGDQDDDETKEKSE